MLFLTSELGSEARKQGGWLQVSCDEDISRHTRQQLSHSPSPSYSLSFFATLHVVSVRIRKNCALCPVYGLGRYPRPRAQFFPLRTSLLVNNIYISTSPNLFTRICMAAIGENYGADIGQILGIHRFKSQHQLLKNFKSFRYQSGT